MDLHPFLFIFELRRTASHLEDEVLARLADTGWPALTPNQLLVIASLDDTGTTPAELARRTDMSRQSMQKNLERLAALGLIDVGHHPSDRRSRLVGLSDKGRRFAYETWRLADGFERRLEAAFGSEAVNIARRVLGADLEEILGTGQNASGR